MLRKILSQPRRVFACLALLTALGIYSGLTLPVSMYPATSKPAVNLWVPYGTLSANSFQEKYGSFIESRIKKISNQEVTLTQVDAIYQDTGAFFEVTFDWGVSFDKALKEVENVRAAVSGMLPREIADGIGVWQRNRNAGFFAGSLYSDRIPLKQLFDEVEPILKPELDKILDAESIGLWNPEDYIIDVRLLPEKMAHYGIYPSQVKTLIKSAMNSYAGSKVRLGEGYQQFVIQAELKSVEDLKSLTLNIGKQRIFLSSIAEIQYGKDLNRARSFKTEGVSSLILFAKPKSGANVKKMSEDIMKVMQSKQADLPAGTQFKIIVDPSEAIQKSVNNLIKDVFLAGVMAVIVLFLFIGGIKNIGTAAIEIPLSMILSFIIMKQVGMNINLISLGGLALAAGMNVDASIVIMENIFRHRRIWANQARPCISFNERLTLVVEAVKEVALPVTLSIGTTLIVFIPMALTSDLTNAILGDLARAVIFSHAISGLVALVVVPAVRVLVLKHYSETTTAYMDRPMERVKTSYEKLLLKLVRIRHIKVVAVVLPIVIMLSLAITLIPKLPKEVIGKPSSDWVFMYINATATKSARHMENILQEFEAEALEKLGDVVDYTWVERHDKTSGQMMFKLFDRSEMIKAKEILKDHFQNSAKFNFYISDWNPAELPLPEEKHFKALIKGTSTENIFNSASKLRTFLKEKNYYERVSVEPSSKNNYVYNFKPYQGRLALLKQRGINFDFNDIAEISKLTDSPDKLGELKLNSKATVLKMSFKDDRFSTPENLESYPIRLNDTVIPLSALGIFESIKRPAKRMFRDQTELMEVTGELDGESRGWENLLGKVKKDVNKNLAKILVGEGTSIEFVWPQKELQSSLSQLKESLLLSLALIFFLLWMQFQSVKQVGIIMMTVPLGVSGVVLSLYIFDSFLSLNSALGIILLNGITVNNSILLIDVTNELRSKGLRGTDLIISAVNKRIRPIFITSLTTMLGMFPMALGLGEGGKILQPLGIAVTCGLLVATAMTLLVVPILLYRDEEYTLEDTPEADIHTRSFAEHSEVSVLN